MPACSLVPLQHVLDIEQHHRHGDAQRRAVDDEDQQQAAEQAVLHRREERHQGLERGAVFHVARRPRQHRRQAHQPVAEIADMDLRVLAHDRRMHRGRRPEQRRQGEGERDRDEDQAHVDVAGMVAELGREDGRQHDGERHAHQAEHLAADRDARALVVVVGELRAVRVIADRHAGIAEMDDEQRHEQPERQQRRLHEQRLGRMEQHVEAADHQRQHQRHEGEPAARAPMGELVADQADDRILDGVDDARGDEDQAHDAERHLQDLAIEVADVQHHRQGRHVQAAAGWWSRRSDGQTSVVRTRRPIRSWS